ncbi:MAG: PIN domain-containing protein [Acidobacteriaceae bacterium]
MRRIYWDTMLFVYWFENNPKYAARVEHIYNAMRLRGDLLCSSPLVYAEVLVGPTVTGDIDATDAIKSFFTSAEISMLPFTTDAAFTFASLRASGIKAPDAMNLATAADAGVDLFVTNDKRLHKITQPGMPFISTLDTDLF